MAKAKVRLTIFGPDHEHECDESEIPGLRAQGLLIEDDDPPAGVPAGAGPAGSPPAGPAARTAAAKEN